MFPPNPLAFGSEIRESAWICDWEFLFAALKLKWIREPDSWCINSLQITAVDFIEIQFYKMFSVDSKVQVWVLDIDITCSYGKLFQIVRYASAEKGWVIARESQGKEENTPLHHHYPTHSCPPLMPSSPLKSLKHQKLYWTWYLHDNRKKIWNKHWSFLDSSPLF